MIDIERIEGLIGYADIPNAWVVELCAEVRALRETIKKQARAAIAGMDAAKRTSTIQLQLAEQARAESSPDVLASERAMNAMLTEENEALKADAERYRWLRTNCFDWAAPGDGDSFDYIALHFEHEMLGRDDSTVDAAIDAEIAAQQSSGADHD